jgi:hypothetical protein
MIPILKKQSLGEKEEMNYGASLRAGEIGNRLASGRAPSFPDL